MSFSTNFTGETNIRKIKEQKYNYTVYEYIKDMSVDPQFAISEYFAAEMNIRKRQLGVVLEKGKGVILQAGAMQWMGGDVNVSTNVTGVTDFIGKVISAKVTKETAIKPRYTSNSQGYLVLEPTYKHILIEDVTKWQGGMVIDDGLFLACDDNLKVETVARTNLSSAVLGGEGLFNTCLSGAGIAVLESKIPREELVEIELNNDMVRIDGPLAIAWSRSLDFTVEKTTQTLIGSAASGEGFVNVYRGTGRILMAPVL